MVKFSGVGSVSGQVQTFIYIPFKESPLKYLGKLNYSTESVAIAALARDGTRMAARSMSIDSAISPEQNILKMRQTIDIMQMEVAQVSASKHFKSSSHRRSFTSTLLILLNAMFLGYNTYACVKSSGVAIRVLNCGLAVFSGLMLVKQWQASF